MIHLVAVSKAEVLTTSIAGQRHDLTHTPTTMTNSHSW